MKFIYRGVILYLMSIIIISIIKLIFGYENIFPEFVSQAYVLAFVTWYGISEILETPILQADLVTKK